MEPNSKYTCTHALGCVFNAGRVWTSSRVLEPSQMVDELNSVLTQTKD